MFASGMTGGDPVRSPALQPCTADGERDETRTGRERDESLYGRRFPEWASDRH
jgi:hypothetical protein